jgi:DNA-binding MarR family transcriptional regulator
MNPPTSTNPGDLNCTCYRLRQSARLTSRLYDGFLAPVGLGIGQFGILVTVSAMEGGSITELAAALQMERTTLTRNLVPLQKLGYLVVAPALDKRVKAVSLTNQGTIALNKAMPLWQAAQRSLERQLGLNEVKTLNAALDETLHRLLQGSVEASTQRIS